MSIRYLTSRRSLTVCFAEFITLLLRMVNLMVTDTFRWSTSSSGLSETDSNHLRSRPRSDVRDSATAALGMIFNQSDLLPGHSSLTGLPKCTTEPCTPVASRPLNQILCKSIPKCSIFNAYPFGMLGEAICAGKGARLTGA